MGITAIGTFLAETLGIGAETASILSPIIVGAGTGAAISGGIGLATGGKALHDALIGGATGAATAGLGEAFGAISPATTTAAPGVSSSASGATTATTSTGGAALGSSAPVAGASPVASAAGAGSGSGGFLDLTATGGAPTSTATTLGLTGATQGSETSLAGASALSPTSSIATPGLTGAVQGSETSLAGASAVGDAAKAAGSGGISDVLKTLGIGNGPNDIISPAQAVKTAVGIGTAGFDLTRPGVSSIPGYSQLSSQASALGAQGNELSSYITTGQLPSGAQSALNQATQSAINQVKSKYANMGQSGSSQEASEIASIQQQVPVQAYQIASQLLQQGISESQISSNIYDELLKLNVSSNSDTVSAISGLAGSLAGSGSGNRIPVG